MVKPNYDGATDSKTLTIREATNLIQKFDREGAGLEYFSPDIQFSFDRNQVLLLNTFGGGKSSWL